MCVAFPLLYLQSRWSAFVSTLPVTAPERQHRLIILSLPLRTDAIDEEANDEEEHAGGAASSSSSSSAAAPVDAPVFLPPSPPLSPLVPPMQVPSVEQPLSTSESQHVQDAPAPAPVSSLRGLPASAVYMWLDLQTERDRNEMLQRQLDRMASLTSELQRERDQARDELQQYKRRRMYNSLASLLF